MRTLRAFFRRLAGWQGRSARERDLQDELEAHFQLHIDANLRAGMSPSEARRDAALRFGSLDSAREQVRDRWTLAWLEHTRRDVLYAFRGLRRNPAFALAAIFSLALGTGAAVAIFTVADNLLLRPLPYRDPGQLVMVWEHNTRLNRTPYNVISPANFRDWKAQNTVFQDLAAFADGRAIFDPGNRPEELGIQYVTRDLLPLTGVQPFRGRLFTPAEDLPKAPDVVILSHRLWQSRFAGDEQILGRTVQVAGRPATIIGILPPNFYFRNREIDLWSTIGLDPARDYRKNSGRSLNAVGRLKPGVTLRAAQTEMSAIADRLARQYPEFDRYWTVNLEPLRDSLIRDVKTSLIVLLAAVGLLLAVACANVANLLLARHTARRREMAVRAAIGAGKGRVIRQLLTESLVLGLTGGLLGLAFARLAVGGLTALAPRDLVATAEIAIDLRIVAFAFALSLATGLLFGLAPAISLFRTDLVTGLREGARGTTSHHAMRKALVAAEVALSIVLLAGAGLLFRTLLGLQATDPGLHPARVLTLRVSLPGAKYREPAQRLDFFARALDSLRTIPGVVAASAINFLPFNGIASGTSIAIAGRPPAAAGEMLTATIRTIMPGYFQTLGIPILQGRDFDMRDNSADAPYRFLVNQSFARRFLAGQDPLTQSVSANMQEKNPYGQIIGVVGDVREGALDREPTPTIYYNQGHMPSGSMVFVLRTPGDPLALADSARRVIRDLDPAQPVADMVPMQQIVGETYARQRFSATLLTGFSLVALLLAAAGIYGVLAYSVTERTREIGVRMALGANPRQVIGMILGSGAKVVAAGAVAGLAAAALLTRTLHSLLYRVEPLDPATFLAVPAVIVLAALLAAWLPARRAANIAPSDALRAE